nr:hypothetical protein Q903MT_gene6235 [Picea sitchensis]
MNSSMKDISQVKTYSFFIKNLFLIQKTTSCLETSLYIYQIDVFRDIDVFRRLE